MQFSFKTLYLNDLHCCWKNNNPHTSFQSSTTSQRCIGCIFKNLNEDHQLNADHTPPTSLFRRNGFYIGLLFSVGLGYQNVTYLGRRKKGGICYMVRPVIYGTWIVHIIV